MTSTPTLMPPSPLGLGNVFSTTFGIFKRRFGLFLGLGLLPVLAAGAIATVFVIALLMLVFATAFPAFSDLESASSVNVGGMFVALIVMLLLYVVTLFAILLVQYRIQAMTVVAASDLSQGRTPLFGELGPRTKGFISRFLTVALLLVGVVVLVSVVAFTVVGISVRQQMVGGSGTAGVISMVVVMLLVYVGAIYVSVRLWYLLPVLALERFSGMQALRRAWQLSGGNFWRILGNILVLGLAVSVPTLIVYVPVMLTTDPSGRPYDDAASITTSLIGSLLIMAVSILTGPFQVVFQTLMYLDQLRRVGEPLPIMPPPVVPAGIPATQYPPYQQQPPASYPPAQYPPYQQQPPAWQDPNTGGAQPPTHPAPSAHPTPPTSYPAPGPVGGNNGAPSPAEPPRRPEPPSGFGETQPPEGNGRPTQ